MAAASRPAGQQASRPAGQQASRPAGQQASRPAGQLLTLNKGAHYATYRAENS